MSYKRQGKARQGSSVAECPGVLDRPYLASYNKLLVNSQTSNPTPTFLDPRTPPLPIASKINTGESP